MNVPFINDFTHPPPPTPIPIPLMAKTCSALHKFLVCAPITGLKLSSLASKTEFYRPKHKPKGEPHGTEF